MWVAHSEPPAFPGKGAQPYEFHVAAVRDGAAKRAERMMRYATVNLSDLAELLLNALDFACEHHDLGKLDEDTQRALHLGRGARLPWDHMDAGIAHSLNSKELISAWLIRAHHSPGFPSGPDEQFQERGPLRGKRNRCALKGHHDDLVARTDAFLADYLIRHAQSCGQPNDRSLDGMIHGFPLRLLLSCLVDADHSDTADWDGHPESKDAPLPDWASIKQSLDEHVAGLGVVESEKNRLRSQFYEKAKGQNFNAGIIACEAGVGLGKSTSVTRHLLNYAQSDQLRHLFIVAPYTNILQQTAQTLRKALGTLASADMISENHHRAEFTDVSSRQYSALWKAPITLTTAVQFFETLASNHPAQLRKLHELPGSVIFLDEAHAALPATMWPQAWRWLKMLTEDWKCKIVLASGTMIRFWEDEAIINPTVKLPELTPELVMTRNQSLESRRVQFEAIPSALNCNQLVELLSGHIKRAESPILCILNTVQSAAVVAHQLAMELDGHDALAFGPAPNLIDRKVLHLSSALSPSDREAVLAEIEFRNERRCDDWILVATSCVEAGIDLDFQTGFRERCSVASFIQTSGRINRHNQRVKSVLYDFRIIADGVLTEHPAFKVSAPIVERMWPKMIRPDAVPAELVTLAMRLEIQHAGGLAETIIKREDAHDYPEVAKQFRIIQTDTRTVVVDSGVSSRLRAREYVSSSELLRHSVQIWADRIKDLGMTPLHENSDIYVWNAPYDSDLLGIMKGILPLVRSKLSGILMVSNIQ